MKEIGTNDNDVHSLGHLLSKALLAQFFTCFLS